MKKERVKKIKKIEGRESSLKNDLFIKFSEHTEDEDFIKAEVFLPKDKKPILQKDVKKVLVKISEYNKYLLLNNKWCILRKGNFVITKFFDSYLNVKELVLDISSVKINKRYNKNTLDCLMLVSAVNVNE